MLAEYVIHTGLSSACYIVIMTIEKKTVKRRYSFIIQCNFEKHQVFKGNDLISLSNSRYFLW